MTSDYQTDEQRRPARGIMLGVFLSLPVWYGAISLVLRVLR